MEKGYVIVHGQLLSTDELYHHGVKGMRWGVRKDRQAIKGDYKMRNKKASSEYERTVAGIKKKYKNGEPLSKEDQAKLSSAEKRYKATLSNNKAKYKKEKASAKAEERTVQQKRKHADQMTEEELAKEIRRLQMQKQYKDLSAAEVSTGKKFVNEVLYAGGKSAATTAMTVASKNLTNYVTSEKVLNSARDKAIELIGDAITKELNKGLAKAIT
jgi:hypothetical protein